MENKYEWLYNNCINGNWRDSRAYIKRKSKKFLVGFIDYLNEFNEIQDILNETGNFPFGCSLEDAGADFGGWNSRAQENLLETICQSCKRAVYVGRGENYQFDEKLGYDICNDCFEKKEVKT